MFNLIWDLDGTLIDSQKEILENLKLAVFDAGLKEADMVKPFRVGPTIDKILKIAFPEEKLADGKLETAIAAFRKRYDNSTFSYTDSFEGINKIIEDERFTHYIITNKPDIPSRRIVEKHGWKQYIKKLVTPYSFGEVKKTKSELFSMLIDSERLDKKTTFGVGDMEGDCHAAGQAGIRTIGVLWGTGTADELTHCNYICRTVSELSELLGTLCRR
jgi:phosphoglycolate phosphatase